MIVSIVITLGLLGVFVVDGVGVYSAHTSSRDAAEDVAAHAAAQFVASGGSEVAAETAARDFAKSLDAELVGLDFHLAQAHWLEATTKVKADTYLLRLIPGLNRLTTQQSAASAHF